MATNPNFVQSRAPDAYIEKLFAFTRCRECARSATNPNFVQSRADKLGSYVPAIKQVFPDAEDIQSEGIRARVNNNLSERLQGTIRDREKTLRGLPTVHDLVGDRMSWLLMVRSGDLGREHRNRRAVIL